MALEGGGLCSQRGRKSTLDKRWYGKLHEKGDGGGSGDRDPRTGAKSRYWLLCNNEGVGKKEKEKKNAQGDKKKGTEKKKKRKVLERGRHGPQRRNKVGHRYL